MISEIGVLRGAALDSTFDNQCCGPPIFMACQRELPNMEVVRLLVEHGQADINAQHLPGQEL